MAKKSLSEADICDRYVIFPIEGDPPGRLRYVLLALVVGALSVAGCDPTDTAVGSTADVTSPGNAEVLAEWVVVKYRDTPVNIAGFAEVGRADSSLVFDAWYDAGNDYMVINLAGTNYHYCAFPGSAWEDLRTASSMGTHYHSFIKGNYDCRYLGTVPD
jgi:hypothetical protein